MAEQPLVLVNDFGHVNGGTAQIAIGDAIALSRTKRAVTFFCAVGPVAPELAASDVRVICLDQQEIALDQNRMRAAGQGLWNARAGRAMSALLAQYSQPPIVHIHGWSKALSGSVVAAVLAGRAPVVVTLHDYFAVCPNGGFYQYPRQRICELTAMSLSCIACNCDSRSYAQKLYRIARQAAQRSVGGLPGGIRHFIHHSLLVREIMTPYLPKDAVLHAVPPAIDATPGPPAAVADHDDFLMVARLAPEKGPLLFAEAASAAGVRPVFVGDGRLREAIRASVPVAEITGWLERDAVAQRMLRARALVFPSLCLETFGLTVAEAMALGLPAIVSDRTAAAELVEDGRTGLLFRTGDAEHLASQLTRLKDAAFAAALGAAAHARYWLHPMDRERHLSALLKVYDAMERG